MAVLPVEAKLKASEILVVSLYLKFSQLVLKESIYSCIIVVKNAYGVNISVNMCSYHMMIWTYCIIYFKIQ